MQDFKRLIELLQNTVETFNQRIPGIQQSMLDSIRTELASLELKNGNIAISARNVRKIAEIKTKLNGIILNADYVKGVKQYAKAFNEVTNLQNQYFNSLAKNFSPPALTNELKKQAITSAVDKLTENGIQANVIRGVEDILRQNITSGGSYSTLQQTLENYLTENKTGEGRLQKYSKQITTDAINQYSGEYTQLVSNDLGFEWYRWSGSNIETTRTLCLALTEKRWVHISEFPAIIAGDFPEFAEQEGKLYKGKPAGMYEDTTADNLTIKRGGYNCGHQMRPVSEDMVPIEVRRTAYASAAYKQWAIKMGKKAPELPEQKVEPTTEAVTVGAKVLSNNSKEIDKLQKSFKVTTHDDLFEYLQSEIKIQTSKANTAYYQPHNNEIVIGAKARLSKSEYLRDTIMAHETAHAIHNHNKIITSTKVDPEFAEHFESLRGIIKSKAPEIHEEIRVTTRKVIDDPDALEQITVISDILGSLTKGAYGGGHSKTYYKKFNGAEKEIFAHAVSLLKRDNMYSELTPEIKQVVDAMKQHASKVLESIRNKT